MALQALEDEKQEKKVANQSTADDSTAGEEKCEEEEQKEDDEEEQVTRAETPGVPLPISVSIQPSSVDQGADEQNSPPSATPDALNTPPSPTPEVERDDSNLPVATAVSEQPVYPAEEVFDVGDTGGKSFKNTILGGGILAVVTVFIWLLFFWSRGNGVNGNPNEGIAPLPLLLTDRPSSSSVPTWIPSSHPSLELTSSPSLVPTMSLCFYTTGMILFDDSAEETSFEFNQDQVGTLFEY